MKTLRGTEKQIAYANGILKRFNETLDLAIEKSGVGHKYYTFFVEYKNEINNIESASEIIGRSKEVPERQGIVENMSDLKFMIEVVFNK